MPFAGEAKGDVSHPTRVREMITFLFQMSCKIVECSRFGLRGTRNKTSKSPAQPQSRLHSFRLKTFLDYCAFSYSR